MSRRSSRARSRQRGYVNKQIAAQFQANLPGMGAGIVVRQPQGAASTDLVDTGRLSAYMSQAMPRDPRDLVPFGPLNPLRPQQLDPSRPDTHRAEPRINEYEVAVNLPGVRDHHHVNWLTLRAAAESVDIMRRCIELRKDHVSPLKWAWTVSPEAVAAAYELNPQAGKTDLQRELREKYTPDINRLTEFWAEPWRTHGIKFAQWVRGMMEEHLVLDAVVVYPEATYGGDLLALNLIDGSTIKPLRDYRGQRPQAPFPAFQQMLYGFPRGEFRASTSKDDDGRITVANGYLADQMTYYRKNFRVRSMYGFSPTEQALIAARLYLRRQGWMLSEYDDGIVPEMIIKLTETTSLTPKERIEYERTLNDELTGQTKARHRGKILFPGMDPVLLPSVDERYKPDYDLFLIKMIASFYGTSMTSLGFSEAKGLGSAGMHQAQADAQEIASIDPDEVMISDLVNDLSHTYLNAPRELTFGVVESEGDETLQGEQAYQIKMNTGRATINEGRIRDGLPTFAEPEASMPFIMGGQGPVFLAGTFAAQQAAQKAAQATSQASTGAVDAENVAKALELRAYQKWAKRGVRARPFEWLEHDADEVASIEKAAAGDGDADPKAPAGLPAEPPDDRWPAWLVDTALAMWTAARIRKALTRGLGIRGLVAAFEEWAGHLRGTGTTPDIGGWLAQRGTETAIEDALTEALGEGTAQAAAVGVRSAAAVLDVEPVDWKGWTPGNIRAARLVLSEDGTEVGLRQLLIDGEARITRIAANRLDEVAAVLADGLEKGLSPREIGVALEGVLDDPEWALTVAWTETNRAQSAAALDTFRARGVTGKHWFTARDQRVCPLCLANTEAGVIGLDEDFPSGDKHPPGHPRCRCGLMPGRLPDAEKALDGGNARQLHDYWTHGEGLAKWADHPHPFAALREHLAKFIQDPDELDRTTAQWHHDALGFWPGRGHDKALLSDPDDDDEDDDGIDKVGPKGYIHGWVFVGIPGVGEEVRHPKHGKGIVTSHAGGMMHADFKTGSHSFETAPKARPPRGLRPRHHEKVMHGSQIQPGDQVKGVNGRYGRVVMTGTGGSYGGHGVTIEHASGRREKLADLGHVKVRTDRPEFEKVRGAEAEQMRAWRRDARKPGREDVTGATRRDEMIKGNEERLTLAREALALKREQSLAEAKRQRIRVSERGKFVDNATQSEAHDVFLAEHGLQFVKDVPAKDLYANIDDPRIVGGRAALPVDSARPLSVYGDMLTIHDNDVRTHQSLTDLEQDVPAHTHALMARYLGSKSSKSAGVFVGSGPAPDLDDLGHLRNEAMRTDNGETRNSWDQAGGVVTNKQTVAIGYAGDWGMDTVHQHSTATHELGHGLDAALGEIAGVTGGMGISNGQVWRDRHAAIVAEAGSKMNPYFQRPEEMWADGFSQWSAGRRLGNSQDVARLQSTFNISQATAQELANYYAKLDEQIRGLPHGH